MRVEVAAVVVTYNSSAELGGLLESIPAAMTGLEYRVVVVDNGSSDRTVETARTYPGVEIIEQPNHGYSAGINAGADAVPTSETILVLNPDVVLEPGSVATMLERMRATGAGIVAPRTVRANGQTSMSLRREPTLLRATGLSFTGRPSVSEYVHDLSEYERPHVTSWAVGAVLLVSRRCHEEMGGWDESYFLYSEETDFCLRAGDVGWMTFYEPRARIMHIGGASGRSDATHTMQILNRVRLYARRHQGAAAWTYWALTLVSETSWLARGQRESKAAITALLRPGLRPTQLGLGARVLPR